MNLVGRLGGIADSFPTPGSTAFTLSVSDMANTLPTRLARLTLYSGTNCSLCDVLRPLLFASLRFLIISQVAKAELAKIRQTVSTKSAWRFGGGSLTYIWTFLYNSSVYSAISNLTSSTYTIQDRNAGGRSMSIGSRLCTSTAKKSRRVAGTDRL